MTSLNFDDLSAVSRTTKHLAKHLVWLISHETYHEVFRGSETRLFHVSKLKSHGTPKRVSSP
jgi:hypothetical protein